MSHYQSKGDRSEAQLKKAGRSTGPGHQRSGVSSPAVKGGGAGGPGPSGSAPPVSSASLTNSQSFPSPGTSGRPTTPGSSTNRGGKRGNGPSVQARNAQAGGPSEHGNNYRNPQYLGVQFHQPVSSVRQSLDPRDSHQHPPAITGQQTDLKQSNYPIHQSSSTMGGSRVTSLGGAPVPVSKHPSNVGIAGAASRPPAPMVPSTTAVAESVSPLASVSPMDGGRSAEQQSFPFQFGSLAPGYMNSGPGMIPARTSSAPPNLDEQKREQARFEASRAIIKKVPMVPSGQQQTQATRVPGQASELPQPVGQASQAFGSQGLFPVVGSPAAQSVQQSGGPAKLSALPAVQYSQGQAQSVPNQGHGIHHTHAPLHIPAQVQVSSQHMQHIQLAAHSQAQAHAQQQQALAQQALPQQSLLQQGLVQQSQGMKFQQPMMPGPQIIPQQMEVRYAASIPLQRRESRPIKIVNPDTKEVLRYDAKPKKAEPFVDLSQTTSGASSGVRVSSNGPPRQVSYGPGPHQGMVPVPNLNYYSLMQSTPLMHPSTPFYQPAPPPKNVSTSGGPPGNAPSARYGYSPQAPYMNHPGGTTSTISNAPASKVGPSGGTAGDLGGTESTSGSPSAPLVVVSAGVLHPIIPAVSPVPTARAIPTTQLAQAVGNPITNGRTSTLVPSPSTTIPAATVTPSAVDFKFGDVETSGSAAPESSGDAPPDNTSAAQTLAGTVDGTASSADQRALNQTVLAGASDGPSSRKDQASRANTSAAVASKQSISVPPSKVLSVTSVGTPKIPVASIGGSPGTVEKSKSDVSKASASSRENFRKVGKKDKQQKQQHSQPPLHVVPVIVESEGERRDETISISPDSGSHSYISAASSVSSVTSVPTTAVKPDVPSHLLPKTSTPSGRPDDTTTAEKQRDTMTYERLEDTSPSGRQGEFRGAVKVALESERLATGYSPGLHPQDSEESVSPTISHEVEGSTGPLSKDLNFGETDGTSFPRNGEAEAHLPEEVPLSLDTRVAAAVADNLHVVSNGSKLDVLIRTPSDAHDLLTVPGVVCRNDVSSSVVESLPVGVVSETIIPSAVTDRNLLSSKKTDSTPDLMQDLVSRVDVQIEVVKDDVLDMEVNPLERTKRPDSATSFREEADRNVNIESEELKSSSGEENGLFDQTAVDSTGRIDEHSKADSGFEDLDTVKTSPSSAIAEEIEESSVSTVILNVTQSAVDLEGRIADENGKCDGELSGSDRGSPNNVERRLGSPEESDTLLSTGNLRAEEDVSKDFSLNVMTEQTLSPGEQSVDYSGELYVPSDNLTDGDSNGFDSNISFVSQHENFLSKENNSRGVLEGNLTAMATPITESESSSTSLPEVKQLAGSRKKKKKEIFAKADAQGPTADLFTAYKAPEEKKLDEVKRAATFGSAHPEPDTKKDSVSSQEKPVLKELDDWEDAAELPTPKSVPNPSSISLQNVSSLPEDAPSLSGFGVKKYTKDYLMSQRELHKDLPSRFEIRADVAEHLLTSQTGSLSFIDAIPSPGRSLDRQPSGGPRLDRRNSNNGMDDERWIRQAGPVASPGRGPGDARMESGMTGPPGGFRPGGQVPNAGLVRMPPGMRPVQPVMSPMGGLIPGVPLIPPHMMPANRNLAGVDADRWQRAPVGQKGLIPSPRTPLPAIHKTENRYQVGKVSDEEQQKQRLIKGILNKLTPQNFDKLFAQVKEVNIDAAPTLTGVISQIFDKALTEPTFCEMYAKFCVQLAAELPEFMEEEEKITFKRVLLNKCQEEFERGEREQEEAEKVEEEGEVKLTAEEREEKRTAARRRMLGNIRFIGELYKKNMLTERIMHECIKKLLGEYQNPDEEDVEALCKLMSTIGRIIDHPKAKEHIDAYFKRMEVLSENMKLSSRLRFMLKDVIDLRRNGWQERRKVDGPKKIDEVHRDAVQERQQAAASGRDRPQQRGGIIPGGTRRPGSDFAMRGPPPGLFSQGAPMGGVRGAPPPPGAMRGGSVQDVRMEDRILMDRPMPIPLSQRLSSDGGNAILAPQGGLGKIVMHQQVGPGRSALADVPPGMLGDGRRPGMNSMPFGMISDRVGYTGREESSMRGQAERPLAAMDRPLLERPFVPERLVPDRMGLDRMGLDRIGSDRMGPERLPERLGPHLSGRDFRVTDRAPSERPSLSIASLRPLTPPGPTVGRSNPMPHALSEDDLKKKSKSTIVEYFSVEDMKEAALCVDDLKNPAFHPTMVSLWVSEALDMKDKQRELLVKLLIHVCKERQPPLLTHDHITKGFELVLSALDDTAVDVPKAPEYVARMLADLILAGVFDLAQVGKLLKEGGTDPGGLLEGNYALDMIGVVLDTIRREKGDAAMVDLHKQSKLNVEDFLLPDDKRKEEKLEKFLVNKNLQSLYPMKPVEKYLREAIVRGDPIPEILKWVEVNVPKSTSTDPDFLRMVMTQVLKHCVPLDASGSVPLSSSGKALVSEPEVMKFAVLLKKCLPTGRSAQIMQRQYIVAVLIFANDLGHPSHLIYSLFSLLYALEVIDEQAFVNWKDDIKDSTPGRDKAIKETSIWFTWLDTAPEEGGEE